MIDILNDIRYGRSPEEVRSLVRDGRRQRYFRYRFKRRGVNVMFEIISVDIRKMDATLKNLAASVNSTSVRMDEMNRSRIR